MKYTVIFIDEITLEPFISWHQNLHCFHHCQPYPSITIQTEAISAMNAFQNRGSVDKSMFMNGFD